MNRIWKTLLLLMTVVGCSSGMAADIQSVYPLKGHQEEGKFIYYINEEKVGTSQCAWNADGSVLCDSLVTVAGQTISNTLKIKVDQEGRWVEISTRTPKGAVVIKRNGEAATISLGAETSPLTLEKGTLIMEDMCPSLMTQAVQAYDQRKGGEQSFPLYFIPAMPLKASLEFLESSEKTVSGEKQIFRKFLYKMNPIYNVTITVDRQDRICLAEYPAQNGVFIRQGFEELRSVKSPDDGMSAPEKEEVLVEKNVGIPMKDGIKLATDIYRPARERKYPVILTRTPYKKENNELQARFYARRGYVFAVQDVRGRFSSPGEWRPMIHEADDGYDTIEWLASRSWATGKVGMIGASYLGWVQWLAASRRPPHLSAMIPNVSLPEAYFNFPHENGALMLATSLWWSNMVEKNATADITGFAFEESYSLFDAKKLMRLPVIGLDEVLFGRKIDSWREWLHHPDYDAYWEKLAFLKELKTLDIPIYHQSGWFDGDGIGSKLNYLKMNEFGRKNQKLILGPWGHSDSASRFDLARGVDWGEKAQVDLQSSYLKWFDRWLKGVDNRIEKEPLVGLFIMGTNDWIYGDRYPLETTIMTKYYLASQGDAGGYQGQGILTTALSDDKNNLTDKFVYDPADPTGANPEGRRDILIFQTQVADKPLTIAGPVSAVLYASTSAKDTDWVMRLARIDRQGHPGALADGVIRARYRESFSHPKLLQPGKVYEYHLDLWQTGITIEPGERLMLVVSSALFPKFSRNLNTGGNNELESDFVKADQTVYHDSKYPSRLLLPILNLDEQKKWSAGRWTFLEEKILSPKAEKTGAGRNADSWDAFCGSYQLRPGFVVAVSREGKKLTAQATGQAQSELIPQGGRRFVVADIQAPVTFMADPQGRIAYLLFEQAGMKIQAPRLDYPQRPKPAERKEIAISLTELKKYEGKYRMDPNRVFDVTQENGRLFVQLTGQPKIEIFAEAPGEFFYKAIDAQISFVTDKEGRPLHLVIHQNNTHIQADRI